MLAADAARVATPLEAGLQQEKQRQVDCGETRDHRVCIMRTFPVAIGEYNKNKYSQSYQRATSSPLARMKGAMAGARRSAGDRLWFEVRSRVCPLQTVQTCSISVTLDSSSLFPSPFQAIRLCRYDATVTWVCRRVACGQQQPCQCTWLSFVRGQSLRRLGDVAYARSVPLYARWSED